MHVHTIRRRGGIVTAFLAATLVLAACGGGGGGGEGEQSSAAALQEGGVLTFGADQSPAGLNNNTSKDNLFTTKHITIQALPQLFNQSREFKPTLGHAFASAELTSQDPQTITVKIKPEAVWSDGTPISADDLIWNWESQNGTNKELDVASTTGYEDIESVTGSDGGKTATIVFKKNFADWQSLFTDILPAHIGRTIEGGWNNGFNDNLPVSGGPYKLESFARGQEAVLVRNDKFWGPKPKLDRIVMRYLPESTTQPDALKNNEVNVIYPQPQVDMVQDIKAQTNLASELNFGLTYEHITYNFENEHLAKLPVRQAIAKGLDRNQLVERTVKQFDSKASVLNNRIFLTGQPQYADHAGEYANRDVAGAKALLEGAGYTLGADGIYQSGGEKLSLRLSTTSGNALRELQCELIQKQLSEIGIEVKLAHHDATKLFNEVWPGGDFDLINFAWVGSIYPISSTTSTYIPGGGNNNGKYNNPEIKTMFDQANGTLDPAQAAQLANSIDEALWRDLPNVPLYQKPTYLAYHNTYGNIKDNATNDGPFESAYTWGLKAAAQ